MTDGLIYGIIDEQTYQVIYRNFISLNERLVGLLKTLQSSSSRTDEIERSRLVTEIKNETK